MISKSAMPVSIIVVNYRSWTALNRLLEKLDAQDSGDEAEIIVVDNDSADGEFEVHVARWPAVEWINSSFNGGFAYGCNLGAQRARGRHLLFLNADVEISFKQIRQLMKTANEKPDVAILTCSQKGADGRYRKVFGRFPGTFGFTRTGAALRRLIKPLKESQSAFSGVHNCDWVSGSLLLIPRAVFDRLGAWCEDYWMYSEDLDLCRRAANCGFQSACTGDITVVHLHGASSRVDRRTEIITRAEVIISKHVYVARHLPPANRWLAHLSIATGRVLPLLLAPLADLLTGFQIQRLNVARGVALELIRYYRDRPWRQQWRGPRAQRTVAHRQSDQQHHKLVLAD